MGVGNERRRGWMPVKIVDDLLSTELRQGRVLLVLSEEQSLDVNAFEDIAIQSTIAAPVSITEIGVDAQMEQVTFRVFEGATVSGGTTLNPININRLVSVTPNSSVLLNPTIDTQGTEITPASGWKLQGNDGFGGSEYVSETISTGAFIMQPQTWYVFRFINTGTNQNRPIQISIQYVDAS